MRCVSGSLGAACRVPAVGERALAGACFLLPLLLYLASSSRSLALDDAAELALCAVDWSVAHPPGFPLYTAMAHAWLCLPGSAAELPWRLAALSALFGASAVCLLQRTAVRCLQLLLPSLSSGGQALAASVAALALGFGCVFWAWANAIEVYALQALAVAMLLAGLAGVGGERRAPWLAGLGLGLGLANHHATMIWSLPTAAVFGALWQRHRDRRFLGLLAAIGVGVAVSGYALLFWRATGQYEFEFGSPDSLRRLWHHLRGGFYGHGLLHGEGSLPGRGPYLALISLRHFGPFLLPLLLGLYALRRRLLPWLALASLCLLALLQAERSQLANLECYLLPSYLLLLPMMAVGCAFLLRYRGAAWALGLAMLLHLWLAMPLANRHGYDVGDAWFADFSHSAPADAVVLLTRWEYRTLARYHQRMGERPDLVVLDSDIKGPNADNVRRTSPAMATALEPEYSSYLQAVAAVDPDYVHSDYYQLSTKELVDGYRGLLRKVIAVATNQRRPLLFDRATVAFLLENNMLRQDEVHPSGILFRLGKAADAPLPVASGQWWDHDFLRSDLGAALVLRDYEQVCKQVAGYLAFHRDPRQEEVAALLARLAPIVAAYAADKPFLGWSKPSSR